MKAPVSEYLMLFIGGVIAILFVGGVSYYNGKQALKREAVENGAAQWIATVDKDGDATVQFQWVTQPEKKEK